MDITHPRVTTALLALTALTAGNAHAFSVFAQGDSCPQAHCTQANTDLVNLPAPPASPLPVIVWERQVRVGEQAGSNIGLGCSANGPMVVCSYNGNDPRGDDDNVIAYDYDGTEKWRSRDELNRSAYTSAPLIVGEDEAAHTIAVDDQRVILFDANGVVVWNTFHGGGVPVSPVMTDSGTLILAGVNGPISAIDSDRGVLIATLTVKKDANDPGYFDTQNTGAVLGERVYLSMQHKDAAGDLDGLASLVALDVDAEHERLEVAWRVDFSAGEDGSKSSPLLMMIRGEPTIFFDGYGDTKNGPSPHIFAVVDKGTKYKKLWKQSLPTDAFASFAAHPDGNSFYHVREGSVRIWRRSVSDGSVVESINIDELIGDPYVVHAPTSAMTITGASSGDPVMLVGVRGSVLSVDPHVVAVDLTDGSLRWKVQMPGSPPTIPAGQFPLVTNGTDTRVVFTGIGAGVFAIGSPSP